MPRMKLDLIQRWMLSNQLAILEKMDPDSGDVYARQREALEHGYEGEYESLVSHILVDTLSEAQCNEVEEILAMYDTLRVARASFGLPDGVSAHQVEFRGFDGNYETKLMGYAAYACEAKYGQKPARYTDVVLHGFNSHSPSLDVYRRQLTAWHRAKNRWALTAEEFRLVAEAAIHPNHTGG
jgi:uncharacterized protein YfbU (UPF0304 family)